MQRGIDVSFLNPSYPECVRGTKKSDFDGLPELEEAVARIDQAIKKEEKVLIYGDYDADGVTASALMSEALRLAGIKNLSVMIPDRFQDGYGMGERLVKRARDEEINLVITVDCGSNNAKIVRELKELGTETIVTDHHECLGELPEAVAMINPKRPDYCIKEDLKNLAGVGVAFMVARELVRQGYVMEGQEKWLLDLVAIGTICDNMMLLGANRILCSFGLKVLKKTRRPGLVELMRAAGVKEPSAEAIGYQLGPRLNAAGRMENAELAFNLLVTRSRIEAMQLVKKLEELNQERKQRQNEAVEEIELIGLGEEQVVVAAGEWHEGVLGIVAGKLMERYLKPSFVLAEVEQGVLKGSGRSFGEFNLALALKECERWLIGGGGHAGACGLRLKKIDLENFKKTVNQYYKNLKLVDQEKFLQPKADLVVEKIAEFSVELVDELKLLEPYGMGNLEPIFQLKEVKIKQKQLIGEELKHLRLILENKKGENLKVVAFFAPEDWLNIEEGEKVDVWFNLVLNEWRDRKTVEGRIVRMERRD